MEIGEVLQKLTGVKKSGSQWVSRCPAHDDHSPSLAIRDGDKGIIFKCHTGCDTEDIVAAIGLEMKDLFRDDPEGDHRFRVKTASGTSILPSNTVPVIKAIYCYRDANDVPLYRVIRYEPKDFRVQHPLVPNPGNDWGKWAWGLNGTPRVPYHLSRVLDGIARNSWVFVVEGEKDVQSLEHRGFVATTNSGGAGKWDADHSRYLAGARVVVLPDGDEPGKRHADLVAASLEQHARETRIVRLPRGKDVTEWFESGGSPEELSKLVEAAKPAGFHLIADADLLQLAPSQIRWAVPDLLPEGLALLAGAPKMGKSYLSLALAGAVGGFGVALGSIPVHKGKSVYLALEDTDQRVKRRREVMFGGSLPGFYCKTTMPRWGDPEWGNLEKWLLQNPDCRLVIVDTLVDIKPDVNPKKTSMNVYETDAGFASEVKAMADRTHVCIMLVHHLNKGDTISGSQGIPAKCDTILEFRRDREDEACGHLKVKGREIEQRTLKLWFNPATYHWTTDPVYGVQEPGDERRMIVDLVYRHARPISIDLIRMDLKDAGKAISPEALRKMMSRLVGQGVVERVSSGIYCKPGRSDIESDIESDTPRDNESDGGVTLKSDIRL